MRKIEWRVIWRFFIKSIPYLSVTVTYVFYSLLFGLLAGAIIAKLKLSENKIVKGLASGYITIMRSTPSIVMIFLIYYGLPAILKQYFKIDMDAVDIVWYVVITFSLFIGASSSEVIRAAFEAVSKGQLEAALSVGMKEYQGFFYIVLPQMIKQAMPNIGNMIIFLFKEGTLAYTIGLQDVLGRACYLSSLDANAYALDMYIALIFIYWPITVALEKLFTQIEKRMTPDGSKRRRMV